MDTFTHNLSEHGFPAALALYLIIQAAASHRTLQRRVTRLESENARILYDLAAENQVALEQTTQILHRVAKTLAAVAANCPCLKRSPIADDGTLIETPETTPGGIAQWQNAQSSSPAPSPTETDS